MPTFRASCCLGEELPLHAQRVSVSRSSPRTMALGPTVGICGLTSAKIRGSGLICAELQQYSREQPFVLWELTGRSGRPAVSTDLGASTPPAPYSPARDAAQFIQRGGVRAHARPFLALLSPPVGGRRIPRVLTTNGAFFPNYRSIRYSANNASTKQVAN